MIKKIIVFVLAVAMFSCVQEGDTNIKITPDQGREPISEYVYGQFIEHLGKCIYGGLWAEMIEDRKFYYPVTFQYNPWAVASDPYWNTGDFKYLNASPWKIIGGEQVLKMDNRIPFTGIHTPVILVPGDGSEAGISQDSLSVVTGKTYKGRIVLAGMESVLPVSVRLVAGSGEVLISEINTISSGYNTYPIEFTASNSSDDVRIEIISKGKGEFKIGTVSLMPSDNIKGWRSDVVALLKELNSPVYRWPGGNFVSGYNWRDGIGDRDKRPPRKNPAWRGVEHNDVGIHEYMELMEIINAEPFIAVNTGLGSVEEVAEELEYCNGSAESPQGKIRAQNGHTEPYNVRWWAVGNEMYGSWQLGHMPLSDYVRKHNKVAVAMRAVDPDIKLIGVGEVGNWSETMLKICSDNMDLISEHIYSKEKEDLSEHIGQLAGQIKDKADAHRRYRAEIPELKGKDIRISMDEWNYWYGDYIYGELGVRYHLKDALGVAKGLHEYFRNSDLYFMANYAQTVNVIGCIKTNRTSSAFAATGLPLKLYRNHFGTLPLDFTGETADLDISVAYSADKKYLTIAIVNPTSNKHIVGVSLGDIKVKTKGLKWTIAGNDPESYNVPGQEPALIIKEEPVTTRKTLESPEYSIVLYRLEVK